MRALRLVALGTADVAALIACRPRLALARHLTAPHRWLAAVGSDGAAVEFTGAVLWLIALWLGVGLAAGVAATLPGAAGRAARRLARVLLPRAVHRLVVGAAGLGVLLSPVTAGAAAPGRTTSAPAPTWPTSDRLPAPAWPTDGPRTAPPRTDPPRTDPPRTARPRTDPPHTATPRAGTQDRGAAAGASRAPGEHAASVMVRRGDSLWRIAATHLPGRPSARRVAAAWPRWFAANRAVVGADPDSIVPGQALHVPAEEGQT